jgi:hypothetical protein
VLDTQAANSEVGGPRGYREPQSAPGTLVVEACEGQTSFRDGRQEHEAAPAGPCAR